MRTSRTLLFVGLCAALTVGLPGLLQVAVVPAEADGEDAKAAQLLVKCPEAEVDAVLRALKGLEVEVYDLHTMKRRTVPVSAGNIPPLPDATRVMEEMITTLAGVTDKSGQSLIRVEKLAVQSRKASVSITAPNQAEFDKAAKALRQNAFLNARGGQERIGALQRLPDGFYRTSISYTFDEQAAPGQPKVGRVASLSLAEIQRAGLAAGVKMMYASPVFYDPNRAAGYRTVSREFTYDPTRLENLRTLVHRLTHRQGKPSGLTVFEIRWKLLEAKLQGGHPFDRIGKPTIAVGVRVPLGD